jgi:hypothetical protein
MSSLDGSERCSSSEVFPNNNLFAHVGFFARRRMRKEREFKEVMRVEEAAADLKIRAMELATMETEEKLG